MALTTTTTEERLRMFKVSLNGSVSLTVLTVVFSSNAFQHPSTNVSIFPVGWGCCGLCTDGATE